MNTTEPALDHDVLAIDEVERLRLAMLRIVRNVRSNSVGDVTPSQLAMMSSLYRHGPSTIGQLADHEHVQPPSASRVIATLEQRGYVERSADPNDRRCSTIALSPTGRVYLREAGRAGTTWLADRVALLEPDDGVVLRAALPVLERLLEEPS